MYTIKKKKNRDKRLKGRKSFLDSGKRFIAATLTIRDFGITYPTTRRDASSSSSSFSMHINHARFGLSGASRDHGHSSNWGDLEICYAANWKPALVALHCRHAGKTCQRDGVSGRCTSEKRARRSALLIISFQQSRILWRGRLIAEQNDSPIIHIAYYLFINEKK